MKIKVKATYLVDVPQNDIDDFGLHCTTKEPDLVHAKNLANLSIESGNELPIEFEFVESYEK